jgi:hypothetical protein
MGLRLEYQAIAKLMFLYKQERKLWTCRGARFPGEIVIKRGPLE